MAPQTEVLTMMDDPVEQFSDEQAVWADMAAMSWHNSISRESIFAETYEKTREQIVSVCLSEDHDIVIELGCGTGEVIGELRGIDHITRIGMDFNPQFLNHCKAHHSGENISFIEQDVTKLTEWWAAFHEKSTKKYTKPLLICVNNTLNIMPEEIRGSVLANMVAVAGPEGRCVISYWNGSFFSHAIMGFYSKNEALCGKFTMSDVNWDKCCLETPSGYSTHWQRPQEVQKMMVQNDVNLDIESRFQSGTDHINTDGLSIFVWFSANSTTGGKTYYDSDDAQTFYSSIWGEETIHVGRYDLLTDVDRKALTKAQQISKAEELHEADFLKIISSKFTDGEKLRILDMGCGYGGLLRQIWKSGKVWSAVGCDIAGRMCDKARAHNKALEAHNDITILEESYLDVSVPDESMDLVLSMDALLHVGPDRQAQAMLEASRALRPYGWIIFSDIMQQEEVDAATMQPIYDRIHLSKMGTVSNYKQCLEEAGFTNFEYISHSENVASHYGTVRQVLLEKKDSIGVSQEFAERMLSGLETWRDLAPENIEWGFIMAQKTRQV